MGPKHGGDGRGVVDGNEGSEDAMGVDSVNRVGGRRGWPKWVEDCQENEAGRQECIVGGRDCDVDCDAGGRVEVEAPNGVACDADCVAGWRDCVAGWNVFASGSVVTVCDHAAAVVSDGREAGTSSASASPPRASVVCGFEFRFSTRICPRAERATRRTARKAPVAMTARASERST